MKVVLVGTGMLPIPPPGWGAVERAIHGLAQGLTGLGVEVTIVNRTVGGRWGEYRFAKGLNRALRGEEWDVLHASTPVVANALALTRHPYVYTSHSRHWFGTTRASERWGLWLERRAVQRSLRVIALTPAVAREMTRGRGERIASHLQVIPNGINASDFHPQWEARKGSEILGVGAVNRRKRWHVAAKAVSGLKGAHMTIVGPIQDPEYAEELRRLATPGRLDLTGEVPDRTLHGLYGRSDLFLLTSGSELMSIAGMEAMASALPVVGTPALSGMVTEGLTGHLIDDTHGEDFLALRTRQSVGALLGDPSTLRRMGEAAREHALREWDWPVVAGRVKNLYAEALRQRPA